MTRDPGPRVASSSASSDNRSKSWVFKPTCAKHPRTPLIGISIFFGGFHCSQKNRTMDCNEGKKRVYRIDRIVHPSLILITPEPESHPPKWRPFLEPPESTSIHFATRISLGSDLHNILLHHCQNRHDHVAVMEEVKMLTWNTHTQKTVLVHCPESLNKCSDSHFFFLNVFDKCCPSHEKNPHQLIHPPFFRCFNGTLSAPASCQGRLHQPSHDVMAIPWGLLGTNSEIPMVSYPSW